jgi:feruloyl-CoA synthase
MVLSENSVNVGVLLLACLYVGVPVSPISPAYSLVSQDHAKLRNVFETVRPGLVYAASGKRFAKALAALDLSDVRVVVEDDPPAGASLFSELAAEAAGPGVQEAFSRVGPDTVGKILFTSGSTDAPKGVPNTQRMMCAAQESMAKIWPFLEDKPPVLLDWLPWNHTFGGNKSFNMVLRNGGTLYIDAGKPLPGAIETTVANLREVSPTISFNVPKGYDALLPFLERDASLRDAFFREMDMVFYAAASLPQNLWERLEKLAVQVRGAPVFMASGWGATETSPVITMVHYPIAQAGVIGLPMPGFEVKLLPNGGKMEMRVRGPNVFPGYCRRPDLTEQAFDEEGFYCIGDAGKFVDPDDPAQGLVFDGRVTEDFKLTTGTWVSVGSVRVGCISSAAPLLQDAVVTGHNRDFLGLLAWPNLEECRRLAPETADVEALLRAPAVVDAVRKKLQDRNAGEKGSSTRIERVLLMVEPPSLDANEITDKGYVNQRATLERRAALVERLYGAVPGDDVIVL